MLIASPSSVFARNDLAGARAHYDVDPPFRLRTSCCRALPQLRSSTIDEPGSRLTGRQEPVANDFEDAFDACRRVEVAISASEIELAHGADAEAICAVRVLPLPEYE